MCSSGADQLVAAQQSAADHGPHYRLPSGDLAPGHHDQRLKPRRHPPLGQQPWQPRSLQSLSRRSRSTLGSLIAKSLLDRASGDVMAIDRPLITEAARGADAFPIERLAALGRLLGQGIASLAAVLDSAVVVIGSGVSAAGDLLLEPTWAHVRANLTGRSYRPELQIRAAELRTTAGMIGAADLAKRS